ncbi:hypothetical protein Bcep18194_B0454 [Burkholderia lata]|uniref:Uncharacterized protein n=1 Tax=Burkholderia lata (strain ATCC 17760 / DSM 23089 / LMG 22485 / NCIMB 9086 / R18194 / 383) TaxID=482957 RepID=Q39AE3_BURL3|nr:hypothetical protein Bcep18194_B0454 [Burkholderia lata]
MRSSAAHIALRFAPIRIGHASLYDNFTSDHASICSDESASHPPVKSMTVQKAARRHRTVHAAIPRQPGKSATAAVIHSPPTG